jgi:hypothetical protein
MATTRGRTEFRVIVEGISLPKGSSDRINKAVQRAVVSEIAAMDLNKGTLVHHINPEWLGIWLRQLSAKEIKAAGLQFEQKFG